MSCLNLFSQKTYSYGSEPKVSIYNVHNGMLYQKDPLLLTWTKHAGLLIRTPIVTIARVAFHSFSTIRAAFRYVGYEGPLREETVEERNYHARQVVKSLGYGTLMVFCNALGLVLPNTGRYLYGDCERLLNNHDFKLEDEKSLGKRCHERYYVAKCFQPICQESNLSQIHDFWVKTKLTEHPPKSCPSRILGIIGITKLVQLFQTR